MEMDPFFAMPDSVSDAPTYAQSRNSRAGGFAAGGQTSDFGGDILDVLASVENATTATKPSEIRNSFADGNMAGHNPHLMAPPPVSSSVDAIGKSHVPMPSSSTETAGSQDNQQQEALDHVWTTMAKLLTEGHIDQKHVSVVQGLIRENLQSKEKITKLKSLLQRSSKAQKEAKGEVNTVKQRLEESQETIRSLHARIDTLANRPTHYLDLVADFESNFDRALLAMEERNSSNSQAQQHTGEASVEPQQSHLAPTSSEHYNYQDEDVDAYERGMMPEIDGYGNNIDNPSGVGGHESQASLAAAQDRENAAPAFLASELEHANQEKEKLEGLNAALLHRASKLEKDNQELRETLLKRETKCSDYQLDVSDKKSQITNLKMMLKDRTAALTEMQLEIDLVTQASVHANVRANEAAYRSQQQHWIRDQQQQSHMNPKYVAELEAKVTALTEWAMASAASKQLAVERVGELEERVREMVAELHRYRRHHLTGSGNPMAAGGDDGEDNDVILARHSLVPLTSENGPSLDERSDSDDAALTQASKERRLWKEASSMVVGAGMVGSHVAELDEDVVQEMAATASDDEIVVLRWKFDLTPSDMDVNFSIFKGKCYSQQEWEKADALVRNKRVVGGGGGDVEGAFVSQNACTLVFSNTNSWIRPRTVKFTVEAVAVALVEV
jgi:hypothetical protein